MNLLQWSDEFVARQLSPEHELADLDIVGQVEGLQRFTGQTEIGNGEGLQQIDLAGLL